MPEVCHRQTDTIMKLRLATLRYNQEREERKVSPRKHRMPLKALMPSWGPTRPAFSLETDA